MTLRVLATIIAVMADDHVDLQVDHQPKRPVRPDHRQPLVRPSIRHIDPARHQKRERGHGKEGIAADPEQTPAGLVLAQQAHGAVDC